MTSVYTWAKSLDDKSTAASAGAEAQGWNGYLNNHNPEADYGRSDFNVGQRFVTSLVYDLPVGRGKQFANRSIRSSTPSSGDGKHPQSPPSSRAFPCPFSATITTSRRNGEWAGSWI